MFEQISQETHALFASLEKLRTHDVLIYGTGMFGNRLYDWLLTQGISPVGFLVDYPYFTVETHRGLPVSAIENYFSSRSSGERAIVVVSFVGYEPQRFSSYCDKADMLCCDLMGIFTLGNCDHMSHAYLEAHQKELDWLASELQDEISKHHLSLFLEQKLTGCYSTDYAPCQYYPSELIHFSAHETFVDCGAYDGDTLLQFVAALHAQGVNQYNSIVAFEPDEKNQAQFLNRTRELSRVQLIRGGAWSEDTVLCFNDNAETASQLVAEGTLRVPVYSIDSVLNGTEATFIKMDIEGAELEALKGAQETIRRWHPTLAICVYHRKEDLFTIPEYIKSLVPDYRLYLRKHAPSATELVLYALPDERGKGETE